MNCLKCGAEIPTGQVFCPSCLEKMAKYPVKPDTPVLLPKRPQEEQVKHPVKRKEKPSLEEQLCRLHRRIRGLAAALCAAIVLLCLSGLAIYRLVNRPKTPRIGQNYSTVASTDASAAPSESAGGKAGG